MNGSWGLWPPGADLALAGALGLIFGSFANVCIHRIPERRSVTWPGSRCPYCGSAIRWYDNIPVISWIALRGRCRQCRAPISIRYPIVEASAALLLIGLCLQHGLTLRWAALSYLTISILALVPIDYRLGILPDRITLTGLAVGLAISPFTPEPGWRAALLGAAAGAAVPLGIRAVYMTVSRLGGAARAGAGAGPGRMTGADEAHERREGMGLGDVKMLAMIGAFLGVEKTILTILLGSVIGTLFVAPMLISGRIGMKAPVPFGPFLGLGAILSIFWGAEIISWYAGLLGVAALG